MTIGSTQEATLGSTSPDDLEEFLKKLEDLGGTAGNKSLRSALRWEDDRYWKAHGRALDQGRAVSGRGKGGSVVLTPVTDAAEESQSVQTPQAAGSERDLYPSAREVIEKSWAKSQNYDDYVAEVTALRGRAATGGKWTRPDIAVLGTRAFPYLPQRFFDIVTFEIKPNGQTTVEGIFEALSHQQFASRSYCVFQVQLADEEAFQDKYDNSGRILSTARKHGIGVIVATKMEDWETWDELLSADHVNPDPEQVNRFIATGFSQEIRDKIIKWHK